MESLLVLLIVFISVFVFLKFAGICKTFTLSGGLKKFIFGLTGLGLIGFNVSVGMFPDQEIWILTGALVTVCLFTLALMSETAGSVDVNKA